MVQIYSRFANHLVEFLNPLHALTKNGHARFIWMLEADDSFEEVKRRLPNATILAHPSDSTEFELVSDASKITVGSVLRQVTGKVRRPLAF